jgi:hypothetical protein
MQDFVFGRDVLYVASPFAIWTLAPVSLRTAFVVARLEVPNRFYFGLTASF